MQMTSVFFEFASKVSKGARPVAGDEVNSVFSRPDLQNCLLLAMIPIVMSIINSSWLYTQIGWLDPWYNVGYFLHYDDPQFLNSYYKVARLSWIIPGFVTYDIFQAIVAGYILHMGCLVVSTLFFYLTVTQLFGPIIAFATAACFVIFVPFHGSGVWDYQNAPAGAYYIMAFYLLTLALTSKKTRTLLIGAGAAYAAAVHASTSFVNMAAVLAVHFLVMYRHQFAQLPSWRSILGTGLWFLSGAVILTTLLGVVNLAVGRDFLFFNVLLEFVISRVQDSRSQAQWWLPWSNQWYLQIPYLRYLSLIVAVFIGCTISVILAIARGRANAIALSLQAEYLFIGILWLIWQSLGHTALQPDYFAYPIYPVMFFAIAGIAANWQGTGSRSQNTILYYAFLAVIVLIALPFPFVSITLLEWTRPHVGFVLIALPLLVVGLFTSSKGRSAVILAAVFAFSAMNGFAAAATEHIMDLYRWRSPCSEGGSVTAELVESNIFLTRFVPHPENLFVWWNQTEVLRSSRGCKMAVAEFAASMTSFGLQYLAPPWKGMPGADELPATSITAITGANKIAVPTANYESVERLVAHYEQAGAPLEMEGHTIVRTSQFSFDLYVLGRRRVTSGAKTRLPLETLQAHPGSTLAEAGSEMVLTTSAQQWDYAANGSLRLPQRASGRATVRVRLEVEKGRLGIGVLARGSVSQFLAEQAADVTRGPVDVYLDLVDVANAGPIVFRSWSPNGVRVRARILLIETVLEDEAERKG